MILSTCINGVEEPLLSMSLSLGDSEDPDPDTTGTIIDLIHEAMLLKLAGAEVVTILISMEPEEGR